MTDEQRALLDEMQALMCVIEGHGTFVMNRIGAERIPSFADMKGAIESRRCGVAGPEKALQRALGIEMKYEQYVLGERFMNEVADRAGVNAVNRVWESRAHFPTLAELREPEAWLRRVGA
jgi:putative hydrolase